MKESVIIVIPRKNKNFRQVDSNPKKKYFAGETSNGAMIAAEESWFMSWLLTVNNIHENLCGPGIFGTFPKTFLLKKQGYLFLRSFVFIHTYP